MDPEPWYPHRYDQVTGDILLVRSVRVVASDGADLQPRLSEPGTEGPGNLTGEDWTPDEVSLIVADYFDMLRAEAQRQPYIKAEHRRSLRPGLHGRSDGAIEFKRQNISAVLLEAGLPYIPGYSLPLTIKTALQKLSMVTLQQTARAATGSS